MSDIKERLKKLRELALRGVGGEKTSAQEILDELLKKYEISIEDLDGDTVKDFSLTYHGNEQRQLLVQTIYKVTGSTGNWCGLRYTHSGRACRTELSVSCTEAQKAEIEFLFSFYVRLWEDEKKMLLRAFIQKHQIFGSLKDGEKGSEISKEELAKLYTLMSGLSDERPLLQIEG